MGETLLPGYNLNLGKKTIRFKYFLFPSELWTEIMIDNLWALKV